MQAKEASAKTDGAGGDEDDLAALRHQGGDSTDDRIDAVGADAALGVRHGTGAELDDDAARRSQFSTSFVFGVRSWFGVTHFPGLYALRISYRAGSSTSLVSGNRSVISRGRKQGIGLTVGVSRAGLFLHEKTAFPDLSDEQR